MDVTSAQPLGAPTEASLQVERRAWGDVLAAFFSSRLLVWIVGIATAALLGVYPHSATDFDPTHLTTPFHGEVFNVLVAPAARWDSSWFLGIARYGYVTHDQTVFFPLYPLLVAVGGAAVGKALLVVVGIVVSCACAIGGLYLLYRLVALDFGERLARNTVWIFAWLPTAVVLSAVYSESLFLLLTVGAFFAARRGRWALAGLLGGLAAADRNGGILLLLPLAMLYFYGPRPDRLPDRPAEGIRPRYAVRGDLLWLALVPAGLLAYLGYLTAIGGSPLEPFKHQAAWGRHFIPLGGIPLAIWGMGRDLIALIGFNPKLAAHMSIGGQMRHIVSASFLVVALLLLRFGWRRLPLAYSAYAAVSLAFAVSVPSYSEPLKSLPRFSLLMFPLWISLALWATSRGRVRTTIAVTAPLLATSTFLFVAWIWPP